MKLARAISDLIVFVSVSMLTGCHTLDGRKTSPVRRESPAIAGGFWEGYSTLVPSNYYGFTFLESKGQLLGTCFQGGESGIRLYFLEKCTLHGSRLEGWKTYPPCNLEEMVEGTFDGDTCRFTEYYTDGHAEILLHRVERLQKAPDVFLDPPKH